VYVYFVKTKVYPQMLKIGKAKDVQRRIAELQTGCPYPLELVGSLKCNSERHALGLEQAAHRLFKRSRSRGEWFEYSRRVHLAVSALLQAPVEEMRATVIRVFEQQRQRYREHKPIRRAQYQAAHALAQMDREFREVTSR
jgi:hypothetical protein